MMEALLKYDSPPLQPKAHWKKRHYKKNFIKREQDVVRVLVEEIRREIDAQIIASIVEIDDRFITSLVDLATRSSAA
jgi:hypothetical protein